MDSYFHCKPLLVEVYSYLDEEELSQLKQPVNLLSEP